MTKGFDGFVALVQTALAENPFRSHAFVYRDRRGDIAQGASSSLSSPVRKQRTGRARVYAPAHTRG